MFGGGKANQYFLRGFNLDHGTDFAVFLDDMPLNLPSYAHGEGYSDMNPVIPEFVERADYEKGPYYADVGNYGLAGSAHLVFYKVLPQDFVTIEGGMYGDERGVAGYSQKLGEGNLLYGGEVYHDDGPWVHPDDYSEFNGLLTYSRGNDGRGATQTLQPISADNPYPNTASQRIQPLVQTKGGEVGVRTLIVPHLQSTLSLWYLYSDSELQQDGDTGSTVASQNPSQRYGVEWANYFAPARHLAFDLDVADSRARFVGVDADDAAPGSSGGTCVPEAVGLVISSGITLHDLNGFSSSLRLRYFGPRDLTSDGVYRSSETILLNWEGSYQINKTWRISAEVLNLLDRRDHDIDYAYEYRQASGDAPQFGNVFHPVEPIQARIGLTAEF